MFNYLFVWLGLFFLFLELFIPGTLFFCSLSLAFFVTSLVVMFDKDPYVLMFFWTSTSIVSFIFLNKLIKKTKYSEHLDASAKTNCFAFLGSRGVLKKGFNDKLFLDLNGEEWPVLNIDKSELMANDLVEVLDIRGNKLLVKKLP